MQRRNLSVIDLSGERVGMLTVIKKKEDSRSVWICKCDCGKTLELCASKLLDKRRKSCGCLEKKVQKEFVDNLRTHGESKTRLYKTWRGILDRCYNENIKSYKYYGARGIKMCDEWKCSYECFREWAIRNGYDEKKNRLQQSIDRIDVNGNYEPQNCRWANSKEQSQNKTNVELLKFYGEYITISEFCDRYGIEKTFAYNWHRKGMGLEKILGRWEEKENVSINYVDALEYSEIIGVSRGHVERLLRKGKLNGRKFGRKWYVLRE